MTQRGAGGGLVATLLVVGLVIGGAVWLSPDLDLGDVRDTVVRHDSLDGVPGSGGDGYTFLSTSSSGAPLTWACEERIEVVVNPEGAPDGYADLVASAVDRLDEVSSFTVEVVGETDERDFLDRRAGPVLLGWADEDEVPALAGPVAGVGGASYLSGPGGGGRAVGGMVVVDRELPRGWWAGVDEESVVLHELLHVLGLGHTDEPGQLMAAESTGQTGLGDGDLAGIAALEDAACG